MSKYVSNVNDVVLDTQSGISHLAQPIPHQIASCVCYCVIPRCDEVSSIDITQMGMFNTDADNRL